MNIRGLVCGVLLAAMCAPSAGPMAFVVAVVCIVGCSLCAARVDRRRVRQGVSR